ncbi:hypothetical protein NEUTE2DRAFT_170613 [Neurospora tetrasperma FGSC 2509]|nr:hypothetical protein NEUTE2DRAFT_170613 [Neurospora tetrasperma FGSC 2509]
MNAVFKLRDRLAHLDRTLKDVSRVISIEGFARPSLTSSTSKKLETTIWTKEDS